MTTEAESGISTTGLESPPIPPAPGAEEQKPNDAPASDADAQNPEETAEQAAKKEESRRSRSNARKAQALADARAEAKLYKEQLERTLAQQSTSQQEVAEPKREDFQSDDAFLKAFIRHEAKQELAQEKKAEREAQQGKEKQPQVSAEHQEHAKKWVEREKAFMAATPTYMADVEEFVSEELKSLPQRTKDAILEFGPAVLHHLATNPEEFDRIAALSPARQVVELGKLEDKAPPPKKVSSAPPPASVTTGGKTGSKDPAKMSQSEYESWRKANGARLTN